MGIPARKMTGVCEITTGQLHDVSLPPAFEGEAGAIEVKVTLEYGGAAANVNGLAAGMYLYDPYADTMTDEVGMSLSGNAASGVMPGAFFAACGCPLLCLTLTDPATGQRMVVGSLPLEVQNVCGSSVLTMRTPTPSEVVYIGRAPYIGADNRWWVWDNETHAYRNSGVLCVGTGVASVNGVKADKNGNVDVLAVNLLDNSNFAKLTAQAGLGTYEKNANGTYVYTGMHGNTPYVADRWKNHGCTVTQHDGFARLTTPSRGRVNQTMENIAGKTVTIAAKIKGSGWVYVGIYYLTPDGSDTGSISKGIAAPDGIICASGTIPAGARDIEARIYPAYEDNGGYGDVYWAALYEGVYTAETLPAYTAEKYSAELMECLRYFHVYATAAARPNNGLDCSPPMRLNAVSQGTVVVNGVTYYYNSADL